MISCSPTCQGGWHIIRGKLCSPSASSFCFSECATPCPAPACCHALADPEPSPTMP